MILSRYTTSNTNYSPDSCDQGHGRAALLGFNQKNPDIDKEYPSPEFMNAKAFVGEIGIQGRL